MTHEEWNTTNLTETCEWTETYVANLMPFKRIAETHNAALAAEREKAEVLQEQVNIRGEMRDEAIEAMNKAEQQLAAERERLLDCDAAHEKGYEQGYVAGWEACDNEAKVSAAKPHDWQYEMEQLQRLIEQLACERDDHQRAVNVALDLKIERDQLREQLAAEREAHEGATIMAEDACKAEQKTMQKLRDWSQHLRIQLAAEVEKVNKLQEQLAAEREKYVKQREDWIREIQQLQDQLDAERETVKRKEQEIDAYNKALAAKRKELKDK